MKELWKDIKNYEGLYQISNLGRIKRLMFINNNVCKKQERILKITDNGNGYKIVGLCNKNRKNFYVHRLVAQAFLENKDNHTQINHKDYNRANNNVENLEWISVKDNINYSKINRLNSKRVVRKVKSKYGKYIGLDNRYNKFYIKVPVQGKIKTLSGFITLEEAIAKRNEYYVPIQT